MNPTDYPGLYQAANKAAEMSQRAHFLTLGGIALTGLIGAALSLAGVDSRTAAVVAAALFFVGLGLSLLMAFQDFESAWYHGRAVAESVKTVTWRFIMKAEPFNTGNSDRKMFGDRLRSILIEHKSLAHDLASIAALHEPITDVMTRVRNMPLNERVAFYRLNRIDEQKKWYATNSSENRTQGRMWFAIAVGLQSGAILCSLLRIDDPSWNLLPTEVFVVAASGVFTWIQAKRFRELAAAYTLASHDISLAALDFADVVDESRFSHCVAEAESAFSREHIQWVARKDLQ